MKLFTLTVTPINFPKKNVEPKQKIEHRSCTNNLYIGD